MRIPNQVLFRGKRRWPEFDCSEAPLPDHFILQLWMLDGAERRYHLAKRWSLWLAQDSLGATEEDPHSRAVTCRLLGQQRIVLPSHESSPRGFQYCEWVRVPPTDTGGEHWLSNILKRRANTTKCWLAPAWQAAVSKPRELGWIV